MKVKQQVDAQRKQQKERILKLNHAASGRRVVHENLIRKGGLTRDQASKKLQGSCRIWIARRELAARAETLWHLVRPDMDKSKAKGGKKPRSYYFNMRTRQTQWIKPKAFGTKAPREVTTTECKRIFKKWWLRGNKVIKYPDMVYPVSHAYLYNTAATKMQKIARAYLARDEAREVTWSTWEEEMDEDTGLPFYRHVLDSYNTKWERPWTPRDSLTRMAQEREDAKKEKEARMAAKKVKK